MMAAFDVLDPCAVVLAGLLVPARKIEVELMDGRKASYGGNNGTWPIRVGLTQSRKDTVTNRIDQSPFPLLEEGVLTRVWTPSRDHGARLAELIVPALETPVANHRLRNVFDVGTDIDVAGLESALKHVAWHNRIVVWSETDLARFCTTVAERARGGIITARHVDNEIAKWGLSR